MAILAMHANRQRHQSAVAFVHVLLIAHLACHACVRMCCDTRPVRQEAVLPYSSAAAMGQKVNGHDYHTVTTNELQKRLFTLTG